MKYWRTRAAEPATTGVAMDVPCRQAGSTTRVTLSVWMDILVASQTCFGLATTSCQWQWLQHRPPSPTGQPPPAPAHRPPSLTNRPPPTHTAPLTAMVVRPQSSALPSPAAAEVMVPGARMSGFTRLSVVGPVRGVGAQGAEDGSRGGACG